MVALQLGIPYSLSTEHIEVTLQWRHNGRDSVSNHQPHDCLLNLLFRRRSNKTSKLRVTGLSGNSPGTGKFPAQMASNAENVSIWWRHHEVFKTFPMDFSHMPLLKYAILPRISVDHFAPKNCHFVPICHVLFNLWHYVWIKRIMSNICITFVPTKMLWKCEKEVNEYIQSYLMVLHHNSSHLSPSSLPVFHFASKVSFHPNVPCAIWPHVLRLGITDHVSHYIDISAIKMT